MSRAELFRKVFERTGFEPTHYHLDRARMDGLVTVSKRIGSTHIYSPDSEEGLIEYLKARGLVGEQKKRGSHARVKPSRA